MLSAGDTRVRPNPSFLLNAVISGFLLFGAAMASAFPSPPSVASGSATFEHSAGTLTIQTGSNTILNWNAFGIGSGETSRFAQPSASNAVLNRVSSGAPTIISGDLSSNGRLYLINPAGFVIASGAHINAGSLTLSTLGLSDADFLAGIPNFGPQEGTGSIVIHGAVVVSGDLSLYAGQAIEVDGALLTPSGPVILPPLSGGLVTSVSVGGGGSISISQGGSLSLGGGPGGGIIIHSSIPEPSAYALFLVGLAGLGVFARRRTN